MDFSNSNKNTRPLSESVYEGLCKILGTQNQVAMRRDVVDIWNIVQNQARANTNEHRLCSGSYGEGFRLQSSDMDIMIWPNHHRVIWDISQAQHYFINRCVPVLADSSVSPPGFTLLWLPIPIAHEMVLSSSFTLNERLYESSSMYILNACSVVNPTSTIHGPCSRSVFQGFEFDNAHCIASDFWPPSAFSWIDRCHSWPKSHVVRDIVRNGCHLVAIGHKLGNYEIDEWRISFSFAEQKLVYSMNHCQFLTYGLLKLFLNEVVNHEQTEESKLLCSYHMKTAVFWVIQQNKIQHWCPQNLLEWFWVCFKLILSWVYEGICPNFFIPENNMFLTKIHGEAQTLLFLRLYKSYQNGVSSLLKSSSIRPFILNALFNPRSFICLDEKTRISETDFDVELLEEISFNEPLPPQDLSCFMITMHQINQLTYSPLTKYQVVMLQKCTAVMFQHTAFLLHNMHKKLELHNDNKDEKNKVIYIFDRMSCHMLKLAAKFGCISDKLYLAMYYYRTCRYREALYVIERTKVELKQPHLMYLFNTDIQMYTEAVGGRSLSTKLEQAVASIILLNKDRVYINELVSEQHCALQAKVAGGLLIPRFILLYMLEFLCFRRIDILSSQLALSNLQILVHCDQGIHIPPELRDISWQILGICQQITGDLQAALYSYQQSLRQYPFHKLQNASKDRIQSIMF